MRFLAHLLLLAAPALAQTDMVPAIVIELKFKAQAVELVSKQDADAHVYRQLGVPQRSPMFFETTGPKGEVLYATAVGDVANASIEGENEESARARREEGIQVRLTMPRQGNPKKFTLYKRAGRDNDDRSKVLEVDL